MDCPFCSIPMKEGCITGDGRTKVRWTENGEKLHLSDILSEKGIVKSAKYSLFVKFSISGYYCTVCRKIIFDTDIEK